METKTLQLVFYTENDKTYTINIDNPMDPIDPLQVKDTMDSILLTDIIHSKNGKLVGIKGAYLVTKIISDIVLA